MVRFHPTVELAPGADLSQAPASWSWTDLTQGRYVHEPSMIHISRGRGDRVSEATPAKCSLTLLNPSGIWVPDNPTGTYYGLIDVNTPLRVLCRPNTNSASDAFNRSVSSGWGTADVGGGWTNVGGSASDFSVAAASGAQHLHTAANAIHQSTLNFNLRRVDITARIRVNALSTGASQRAGLICRYFDSVTSRRVDLIFATSGAITAELVVRAGGVETPGASASTGLTHSTSSWYWVRLQTGFTSARVKVWLDGTDEPATWLLDGADGAAFISSPFEGRVGLFSRRETSNTNSNATVDFDSFSMVDGPLIRFTGYVDDWPTSWTDASERTSLAPITASGHLARLAKAKALRSASYRVLSRDAALVAYWPMEDGSGAASFASATGGVATPFTDVSPAADSDVVGSDPLPVFGGASHVFFNVPRYAASTSWSLRFVCKVPASPPTAAQLISWGTATGSIVRWQLTITPGSPDTIRLDGYSASGVATFVGPTVNFTDATGAEVTDGRQLYFEVDGVQSGANIEVTWAFWFADVATVYANSFGRVDTVPTATIGNVNSVYFDGGNGFPSGNVVLGHVAVGSDTLASGAASTAAVGYSGESTTTRFGRLCTEESVASIFGEILGTTTVFTDNLMGAQRSGSLLDQFREVEATEHGVLFDGIQGQVTILPRSLRYNHAVNLTLDHDSGVLKEGFRVDRDTTQVRNDVEVSNASGFRASKSDAASIARYGVQPQSVAINALDDNDAAEHASFRVAAGKTPDRRYSAITLEMHRPTTATIFESWLSCDIGYRINLTNLPSTFDTADLLIDGYTETFNSEFYTVTINASPSQPYDVQVVESSSGNLGRADTSGCTLLAGYDSAATTLLVATTPGKRQWSTTAEPYDWGIAGERLTVTTMNTNAASFVNAGTASHGDNATLTPSLPASVTKGDLLLVFTAIRNTSATITTPTGYTALLSDGNVALFGKIHTGTESAPSVAFSGGSAGDTTSAQMAAFRYTQCSAALTASSSNASAQNIAVPAALPPLHNAVALWLGWKQDDWTSVATVYGTEIGEPSTTTGNDQGLVWDYQIQTTATERAASSFVVTGGASAISKGFVVWLPGDVQSCTVTRSVNGVAKAQTAGTSVSLWRPGRVAL